MPQVCDCWFGSVTWSLIYTTGLVNNLIIVGAGRETAFAAALLGDNALLVIHLLGKSDA